MIPSSFIESANSRRFSGRICAAERGWVDAVHVDIDQPVLSQRLVGNDRRDPLSQDFSFHFPIISLAKDKYARAPTDLMSYN